MPDIRPGLSESKGRLLDGAPGSDGMYRTYIEDVIVASARRSEGIAHALVDRLLQDLPATAVVSLFCSPRLQPLCADMGFNATQQTVMHRTLPRI